jgi:hypothetical protein
MMTVGLRGLRPHLLAGGEWRQVKAGTQSAAPMLGHLRKQESSRLGAALVPLEAQYPMMVTVAAVAFLKKRASSARSTTTR